MTTNEQRREATRGKLIGAALTFFVRDGYAAARTENILQAAGVSRGAMYHHFQSKSELFEAVFISVTIDTIARAQQAGSKSDSPLSDLLDVCLVWLRCVRRPDVAAILLDQAPQVLGWKRAREIEAQYSLAPMQFGIEKAIAAGEAGVKSVEFTALLINAVLTEAALEAIYKQTEESIEAQEEIVTKAIQAIVKA